MIIENSVIKEFISKNLDNKEVRSDFYKQLIKESFTTTDSDFLRKLSCYYKKDHTIFTEGKIKELCAFVVLLNLDFGKSFLNHEDINEITDESFSENQKKEDFVLTLKNENLVSVEIAHTAKMQHETINTIRNDLLNENLSGRLPNFSYQNLPPGDGYFNLNFISQPTKDVQNILEELSHADNIETIRENEKFKNWYQQLSDKKYILAKYYFINFLRGLESELEKYIIHNNKNNVVKQNILLDITRIFLPKLKASFKKILLCDQEVVEGSVFNSKLNDYCSNLEEILNYLKNQKVEDALNILEKLISDHTIGNDYHYNQECLLKQSLSTITNKLKDEYKKQPNNHEAVLTIKLCQFYNVFYNHLDPSRFIIRDFFSNLNKDQLEQQLEYRNELIISKFVEPINKFINQPKFKDSKFFNYIVLIFESINNTIMDHENYVLRRDPKGNNFYLI